MTFSRSKSFLSIAILFQSLATVLVFHQNRKQVELMDNGIKMGMWDFNDAKINDEKNDFENLENNELMLKTFVIALQQYIPKPRLDEISSEIQRIGIRKEVTYASYLKLLLMTSDRKWIDATENELNKKVLEIRSQPNDKQKDIRSDLIDAFHMKYQDNINQNRKLALDIRNDANLIIIFQLIAFTFTALLALNEFAGK